MLVAFLEHDLVVHHQLLVKVDELWLEFTVVALLFVRLQPLFPTALWTVVS